MKRKTIFKIIITLITIFLIIDIIASFYFYNLAIDRNEKEFLQGNQDLEVSGEAMDVFLDGDWRSWREEQSFEEIQMTSFDGLELQGYFLPAKNPTNKTVILAHGYLGQGMDMALYAQYYYESLGYNIFTADARGHGKSEGDYIGFGWHDRLDYVKWIDEILDKVGSDSEIVLHGLSMGAATVLMTSGEDLPDNVKAVIADSPYTSVHDMFRYQMKRMFHLPSFPFLNTTSMVTKARAGYSLKEASSLEQVKKAEVPILYIHGGSDTFVPTKLAHELYEETNSEAELLTVPDAGHGESYILGEDEYIETLTTFLAKYID